MIGADTLTIILGWCGTFLVLLFIGIYAAAESEKQREAQDKRCGMVAPLPLCFGSVNTWYYPDENGRIPERDIYGYPIPDEARR